jgi:hypothetical protein
MKPNTQYVNLPAARKIQKMVEDAEKIFDETFGPVDHNSRKTEAVFRRAAYALIIKPDHDVLRPSYHTIAYAFNRALKTKKCLAHCSVLHNRKTALNLLDAKDKVFSVYFQTAALVVHPVSLAINATIEKP